MRESRLSIALARLLELVYGLVLVALIVVVGAVVWLTVPWTAAVWEGLGAAVLTVALYWFITYRNTKH